MPAVPMSTASATWRDERATPVLRPLQPAAMIVAIAVLVAALAGGLWPAWGPATGIGLLGAGLAIDFVARRVRGLRTPASVLSLASLAALLAVSLGATVPHPPTVLPWTAVLLTSLGLVAGSAAPSRHDGGSAFEAALPLTALVTMLVLDFAVSKDGYGWFTGHRAHPFILDDIHTGTIRLVMLMLTLVVAAAVLPRGEPIARGAAGPGAAIAALTLLLATVVSVTPQRILHPEYPYWCGIALLTTGLAVDLATRVLGVRLLTDRISELSRTRSGALDVQADELHRIERDLHDGAQVRLVALSMKLGRAEDRYRDDPETAALLREAREDAAAAIRELRELARGIASPVLARRGLDAAVRSLAQRSGLEVSVRGELARRPIPAVESAAYFVVAESLANAAKHAPGARVEIGLHEHAGDLLVEITDFGPGGADRHGGGLTGLRRRVEALDGTLRVTSPPAVGTQVEAVVPCGR